MELEDVYNLGREKKKKKELELPRRGVEPRISRLMLSITVERIKPTMLSGGCEWVAGPNFDILRGLPIFTYTKAENNISRAGLQCPA